VPSHHLDLWIGLLPYYAGAVELGARCEVPAAESGLLTSWPVGPFCAHSGRWAPNRPRLSQQIVVEQIADIRVLFRYVDGDISPHCYRQVRGLQ